MKLLESYALATGLKIGRQYLTEHFFPLPFTRYITLHASSGMQGKNWPFYGLAVEIIKPYLDKENIQIVQIGGKDDPPIQGCYHIMGKDNMGQGSYIVRNAMLHLGNDSVWGHRAGHLGVPLVQPWGSTSPANHSCFDADPEKTILLESHRRGHRPTFALQENPQSIAFVDPYDVARAVLKLLKIENSVIQRTLNVGPSYNAGMLELIPNCSVEPAFNPHMSMAVRMDLQHDENVLAHVLGNGRKVNIVTKAPINVNLLAHYRGQILSYNHEVDDQAPGDYIIQVKKLIKESIFFTRAKEEDVVARIRYALFNATNVEQVTDKTRADFEKTVQEYLNQSDWKLDSVIKSDKLKFKAQKYVLSRGKIYLSHAHEKADLSHESEQGSRVIDTDEWYRDYNHFFVYEN